MMMSTIQAARSLEISTNTMREWALKGYIPTAMKTPTGYLKFREEDVEELRRKCEEGVFPNRNENK